MVKKWQDTVKQLTHHIKLNETHDFRYTEYAIF